MIELYTLRQFTVFADCGTLSEAAEILHLSQPALLQKFFTKQSFVDVLSVKPDRQIHIRRFPILRHGAPPPFSFV